MFDDVFWPAEQFFLFSYHLIFAKFFTLISTRTYLFCIYTTMMHHHNYFSTAHVSIHIIHESQCSREFVIMLWMDGWMDCWLWFGLCFLIPWNFTITTIQYKIHNTVRIKHSIQHYNTIPCVAIQSNAVQFKANFESWSCLLQLYISENNI